MFEGTVVDRVSGPRAPGTLPDYRTLTIRPPGTALVVVGRQGRGTGEKTPGLCGNPACLVGRSKRLIRVSLGAPFTCPGCLMPLSPPAHAARPKRARRAFLFGGMAALMICVGLATGAGLAVRFSIASGSAAASPAAPPPLPHAMPAQKAMQGDTPTACGARCRDRGEGAF
jgi:hypothetical protein